MTTPSERAQAFFDSFPDERPDTSDSGRILAVATKPVAVKDLNHINKALRALYGDGVIIRQGRWTAFEFRTPGEPCWCRDCEDRDAATVQALTGDWAATISRFMIVCPDCGNKRCPRATNHHQQCGGSNEPGQSGSAYQ